MLLQIEMKGKHLIVTNNPPIKYRKFSVNVNENDFIPMEMEAEENPGDNMVKKEVQELREKYPELMAIDKLTQNWMVSDNDDDLLKEYYSQCSENDDIDYR